MRSQVFTLSTDTELLQKESELRSHGFSEVVKSNLEDL